MKKNSSKKIVGIILILIFATLVLGGGLLYIKVKRVIHSISDSAQKADSQNTPLGE